MSDTGFAPIVGIITALPKEFTAMKCALAEGAECVVNIGPRANIKGWCADVKRTNGNPIPVILILIGDMGNNAASYRASQLLSAFRTIQHIVMAGIAGGVPHPDKAEHHVRLGDIVVSNRYGVIQYDFDKETQSWIQIRSRPMPPSSSLYHATQLIEAEAIAGRHLWDKDLDRILATLGWARPPSREDVLTDPTEAARIIRHPKDLQRRKGKPRVFSGLIGSANKLLKHATKRDTLRDKYGVKAIEMEGSGIADATWSHEIGYLVVRGICDYCDSNKGDTWQDYAAAAAAAYTITLLRGLPAPEASLQSPPRSLPLRASATFAIPFGAANLEEFQMIRNVYELYGCHVVREQEQQSATPYLLIEMNSPGFGINRAFVGLLPAEAVTPADIGNWISNANTIAKANSCSKTIVVHNHHSLPHMPDAAPDIMTISLSDLESQILDLRPALARFATLYESMDIYSTYISLGASVGFDEAAKDTIASIEQQIREWISSREHLFLSVLGDYGAGKTTLMNRLKYYYAKSYAQSGKGRKPVLIHLRDYDRWNSLEGLLRHSLVLNFDSEVPLSTFWRGIRNGDFLILLDGFDEMAAQSDLEKRRLLLHSLSPLFHTKSPVILTCRPSYFVSADEYNSHVAATFTVTSPRLGNNKKSREAAEAINALEQQLAQKYVFSEPSVTLALQSAKVVRLTELSGEQIDEYLRRRNGEFIRSSECSWEEVKQFLVSVYDLSDLMRRPIILSMIADTVIAGHIDVRSKQTEFGPTTLYRVYTNMELSRDWQKGSSRQLLTKDERSHFAITLALTMFDSKTLEVTHEQILNAIQKARHGKLIRHLRESNPDTIATDIRTCAFLTTQGSNTYRFTHRSFMEYFVAQHFYEKIKKGKGIPEQFQKDIPHEILYFLGGFAFSDSHFATLLRNILDTQHGIYDSTRSLARNIAVSVLYSGHLISQLTIKDIDIYSFRHQRLVLKQLYLSHCRVNSVQLSHATLLDSKLTTVELRECSWSDITIERTDLELDLDQTEFARLAITNGNISLCGIRVTSIREPRLTSIGRLSLSGPIRLIGGSTTDTKIGVRSSPTAHPSLSNHELVNCQLVAETMRSRIDITNCRFRNCYICGITVSVDEVGQLAQEPGLKGYVLLHTAPQPADPSAQVYLSIKSIVAINAQTLIVAKEAIAANNAQKSGEEADKQRVASAQKATTLLRTIAETIEAIAGHDVSLHFRHFTGLV